MAGGITLTLFSLSGAVGGMVGGLLSDTWNRKGVIAVSGLVCVPLLLGMFRTDARTRRELLAFIGAPSGPRSGHQM